MNILQEAATRTRQAIGVLLRGARTAATAIVGRGMAYPDLFNWLAANFQMSYERTQVHKDVHRMDCDDGVVTFALNTITSRALGLTEDPTLDSFSVNVQKYTRARGAVGQRGRGDGEQELAEAQAEIEDLVERTRLQTLAWQIIRRFVKFGNDFYELLIDQETRDIVGLKPLPEHTVWPNKDAMGNRLPGYIQRPENMPTDAGVIGFAEWEILHFAFGEIDDYRGTPLLKSSRKDWKRLHLALDFTGIARIIRAFMKLVHKIPVRGDWSPEQVQSAINQYKEQISKRPIFDQDLSVLEKEPWPHTVSTDLYIPDDGTNRGGVEMLDPENAQLQNIRDIEHFMDRFVCATHIPKRYFPFEGSTPKLSEGGGQAEDKNFACLLVMCQNVLKQGLRDLFDRQLLLKGINPKSVKYVFRMANINTVDQLREAQTQVALSAALVKLLDKYPELRPKLAPMLRQYTRFTDAALDDLVSVEIKDEPKDEEPDTDGNGTGKKTRIQLPGTGVGPEVRTKV